MTKQKLKIDDEDEGDEGLLAMHEAATRMFANPKAKKPVSTEQRWLAYHMGLAVELDPETAEQVVRAGPHGNRGPLIALNEWLLGQKNLPPKVRKTLEEARRYLHAN